MTINELSQEDLASKGKSKDVDKPKYIGILLASYLITEHRDDCEVYPES